MDTSKHEARRIAKRIEELRAFSESKANTPPETIIPPELRIITLLDIIHAKKWTPEETANRAQADVERFEAEAVIKDRLIRELIERVHTIECRLTHMRVLMKMNNIRMPERR